MICRPEQRARACRRRRGAATATRARERTSRHSSLEKRLNLAIRRCFMATRILCCADIGGTNARLQLWEVEVAGGTERLRSDKRYATAAFSGLEPLLRTFLSQAGLPVPDGEACSANSPAEYGGAVVDACSVAICMPVENERRICGPGGVSWALDVVPDVELALGKVIRKCTLINDFVAVGLGIHALEPSQVQLLTPNVAAVPRATALCLGPGTGLGTCFLTYNESVAGYEAHPGEGGAPEFAARTAEEWAFKQFLESEGGRSGPAGSADGDLVIVENMVSGPGLGNCFRFLSARQPPHWGPRDDIRPSALDGLENDELPAAVASRAIGSVPAGEDSWVSETCIAAMELWLGSFVRELRAASLRFLPTGGLYLAGGVCTKLMPRLGEVRTVIVALFWRHGIRLSRSGHRVFCSNFVSRSTLRQILLPNQPMRISCGPFQSALLTTPQMLACSERESERAACWLLVPVKLLVPVHYNLDPSQWYIVGYQSYCWS